VTVTGPLSGERAEELISLARHEEAAEKSEHPLNRIIDIERDGENLVIQTTNIHLPRRIGEAARREFHGEFEAHFDKDGYFARITCSPAS
jgi:hypothetical protein